MHLDCDARTIWPRNTIIKTRPSSILLIHYYARVQTCAEWMHAAAQRNITWLPMAGSTAVAHKIGSTMRNRRMSTWRIGFMCVCVCLVFYSLHEHGASIARIVDPERHVTIDLMMDHHIGLVYVPSSNAHCTINDVYKRQITPVLWLACLVADKHTNWERERERRRLRERPQTQTTWMQSNWVMTAGAFPMMLMMIWRIGTKCISQPISIYHGQCECVCVCVVCLCDHIDCIDHLSVMWKMPQHGLGAVRRLQSLITSDAIHE